MNQFRPLLECLEDRLAPALGYTPFAQFTGTIAAPQEKDTLVINLRTPDFALPVGGAWLGVAMRAANGSTLDPASIRVVQNGRFRDFLHRPNVPGENSSLTLAKLKPGSVTVILSGSRNTVGSYVVETFLPGDLDGDFRVTVQDVTRVRNALRQNRSRFPRNIDRAVDFNQNNRIDRSDYNVVLANRNVSTTVRPLSISAALSTESDPDGDGVVMRPDITVTGQTLPGAAVRLDQGADGSIEQQTTAGADGRYSFALTVSTGQTTLRVTASDPFGQQAAVPLTVTRIAADTTPPTATIGPSGILSMTLSSFDVVFSEPMASTAFQAASYTLQIDGGSSDGQVIPVSSVIQVDARTARISLASPLADQSYRFTISSGVTDLAGNPLTGNRTFRFIIDAPVRVSEFSPFNGEEMVNVARETIVRFDGRIDPATITPDSFHLIANGERVPGRIVVSSTEQFVTFFYNNPLPASTEVRIVLDGNRIRGRDGQLLDADGDGQTGGRGTADFRTLPLTRIAGTNVFGFVYDSVNRNPDGSNRPIVGATIRVDAFPQANVVTDANGRFELPDMPAPEFFVHIDGSTATNAPAGFAYPSVGKPFHSVPGQTTQLNMGSVPFNIYLPPMANGDVQPLSPTQATNVGFGPAGRAQLQQMFPTIDPATWSRVQVTIAPGSAMDEQGTATTQAIIIPVPPDRLPAPLPPNVNPQLVISVQALGATNFDVPVPVTFPNVEGLSPGEKASIVSFNHDAGRWEMVGFGTVSTDGRVITSDPGAGILAPGWHFAGPPTVGPPPPCQGSQCCLPGGTTTGSSSSVSTSLSDQQLACVIRLSIDLSTCLAVYLGRLVICASLPPPAQNACIAKETAYFLACEAFAFLKFAYCLNCASAGTGSASSAASSAATATPPQLDPILSQLHQRGLEIADLLYPYGNGEIPAQVKDRITSMLTEMDGVVGGSAIQYLRSTALRFEQEGARFGESPWPAPDRSLPHVAEIEGTNGNLFEVRGSTRSFGQYTLFQPRDGGITSVSFYDPQTNSVAIVQPYLRADVPYRFPRLLLQPVDGRFRDFDNDDLVDVAEFVLGTDAYRSDTDNDGILDLAETQQGLDPLNNRSFPTGIISTLSLRGEATEVTVEGSAQDGQRQTAFIATGSYGLAIVDASRFNNPIILGQLDLPGDATDVAVDSNLRIAAAATNAGGLHLIDISDPMQPIPMRAVNVSAVQVEVVEGVAYVAAGNALRAYDLLSGDELNSLVLSGASITGLAREGSFLYTMDSNRALRAIDISGPQMVARGSLTLPDGGGKLFVGNGIAYAAAANNPNGGLATANVSNPDNLTLISGSDVGTSQAAPRTAVVANGSGLAVLVGTALTSPRTDSLELLDISNPADTYRFLTRINLPAAPNGVALASGIAYVAGGSAGLQVINYRAFDNQGRAPTVTITSPVADVDPATPGIQVTEGGSIPVVANVQDDVQVRNVELLVNGQVVRNDVSFPFDLTAIALGSGAMTTTTTVQVCVTDTGGNSTLSNTLTFNLVPDTFAPTVLSIDPADGDQRFAGHRTMRIRFSEPIRASSVTANTVQIFEAGPGGVFGDGNDIPVVISSIQFRNGDTVIQLGTAPLTPGNYELRLARDQVTDRAGNPLGTGTLRSRFTVLETSLILFGGSGDQRGAAITVSGPNLYVSGTSGSSALLLSYPLSSSTPAWSTTPPGNISFSGVAASGTSVYAAGSAVPPAFGATDGSGGTEGKSALAVYNAAGVLQTAQSPNFFPYRGGEGYSAVITVQEGTETVVYAAGGGEEAGFGGGRTILAKYSSAGSLIWKRTYGSGSSGGSSVSGLVSLNNFLYAAGGDQNNRGMLFKYNAAAQPPDANPGSTGADRLTPVWSQITSFPAFFRDVTAAGGFLYAVGHTRGTAGNSDYLIQKYDEAGNLVWSRTSGGTRDDVLTGVVAVGTRLFAVGHTLSEGAGGVDAVLLEIDPATGNTLSRSLFGGTQDDLANDVATDGTRLYVVGESRSFAEGGNPVGQNDVMILSIALPPSPGPGGSPLRAAGEVLQSAAVTEPLTPSLLEPLVREARSRWKAGIHDPTLLSALESVQVSITDLPGSYLGLAVGNTILIDVDAAGHGWFLDATPFDDAEFTLMSDGELRASGNTPIAGQIDLLTVLVHEMGHALGLDDLDTETHPHDVMAEVLAPGVRRSPGIHAVDLVFGTADLRNEFRIAWPPR